MKKDNLFCYKIHESKEILELKDEIEKIGGKFLKREQYDIYPDSEQTIISFPNTYGASIIRKYGSYGYEQRLFEIAPLKITDEEKTHFDLIDDVEGYLTADQVMEKLIEISNLEI